MTTEQTAAARADAADAGSGAGQDRSLAAYLKIGADGVPFLQGARCSACGETVVGQHRACPKCATVGALLPVPLAREGKLYCYAIVHRSFPGVRTPIVSAVVRLDDGAFVRGNLERVAPEPEALPFDMPVRVEIDYLEPRDGHPGRLIRPVFVPSEAAAELEP